LQIHPNGATAMRHLAASKAVHPVGCTQSTEIISTEGVVLSGSLPPGCELATMYTAAVTTSAAHATQARILIELLGGADQRKQRESAGFREVK
jgi:molybdate transport system substrate-binding protein